MIINRRIDFYLIVVLALYIPVVHAQTPMNQNTMENIVKDMASFSKGRDGYVEFNYNNQKMLLISDVKHDRMRIITPIARYNKLLRQHIDAILESNFHKALDARYAVSDGILYSAFIHPMSALSHAEIQSAVKQVSNLAQSFGSEYTSGVLNFNAN